MHAPRLPCLLAAVLLLAGCGSTAAEREAAAEPRVGPLTLVEELRGGGFVLYLRHTATDMSQKDTQKTNVASCTGMRNLDGRGREQARTLGRAFRSLGLPVGEVRASAYCRTRETAELAFGRYVRDETLTGFPEPGDEAYEERLAATRELLSRRPPRGENTVLVAHVKNLEAAADLTIEEGELAVFEPRETGFLLRGRIPASLWPHLEGTLTRDP